MDLWRTTLCVSSLLVIALISNLLFLLEQSEDPYSFGGLVNFVGANTQGCSVALGVFSKAPNTLQRDVIRQTWGKIASQTSRINFYFVIAGRNIVLSPHETVQFEREQKMESDILLLDVLESSEHSYSKSLAWFSWVADMTSCEIAFKTEDDSYVRLPALIEFVSSKVNGPKPCQKYFGIQIGSWDSAIPYMSRVGYGVTSDVAKWISKNKKLAATVPSQHEDVAVGVLLSYLRNTTGLDYITGGEEFGGNCDPKRVLDSPSLSHNFNMYVRFHDDVASKFCDHMQRSTVTDAINLQQKTEDSFRYDLMLRTNIAVTDDSYAPWNRNNRQQYIDIEDYSHFLSIYAHRKWFPWFALTNSSVYGGAAVVQTMDPIERANYALVLDRTIRVFHSLFPTCPQHKVVGGWLKDWGSRKEYVANLLCVNDSDWRSATSQALVHVPFLVGGGMDSHSPAHVVGDSRLVVITPITCRLNTLRRYLMTSGVELGKLVTREKQLILSWSYCSIPEHNFTEAQIISVVEEFKKVETAVEVKLVYFQDGKLFSRSKALNAGILSCTEDDLLIILDVDLQVMVEFFFNALAFTRRGHSMYFPIMFSRFNPDLIQKYAEVLKPSNWRFLNQIETITAETGIWRDFSLGTVAMFASDANALGLYDSEIEGWGDEDVLFFEKSKKLGYVTWRPYDLKEIHLYHRKQCEDLRGGERYKRCLMSKLRQEGSQLELAIAHFKLGKYPDIRAPLPAVSALLSGRQMKKQPSRQKTASSKEGNGQEGSSARDLSEFQK